MFKMQVYFTLFFSIHLYASELSNYLSNEKENIKIENIQAILFKEKKLNGDDTDYGTPIAWATYNNNLHIVKYLISNGADINRQSNFHSANLQDKIKMIGTPLHVACINGNYEAAKILLEAGADPYVINPYGRDSFQLAEDMHIKKLLDEYRIEGKLSTSQKKKIIEQEMNGPIKYSFNFKYYTDIKKGVEIGTKENKPIVLILMSNSCRACNKYVKNTLMDDKVTAQLKNSFVVVMLKSSDGIPKQYKTPVTPTTWFLNKGGNAVFEPVHGFISKISFLKGLELFLKVIKKNKSRQFKS